MKCVFTEDFTIVRSKTSKNVATRMNNNRIKREVKINVARDLHKTYNRR